MSKDMAKELLEALLHPVRMRIWLAMAGSPGMPPLQIAGVLADIPQATLYRQIGRLAKSGILSVVEERPVRGTLEKVYALNRATATHLDQETIAGLSKADHLRYFTSFVIKLVEEFSYYLENTPQVDLAADGVGYNQVVLFMNGEELAGFARTLNAALAPYLVGAQPSAVDRAGGRKKHLFSTVLMPEVSGNK